MIEAQHVKLRFLKDVVEHQLNIVIDDGVNRLLRFKNPNSAIYYFDIVTWKGNLVISGDCGTFSFRRLSDMFEFFSTESEPNDDIFINPRYWSQKLTAEGVHEKHEAFDEELFKKTAAEQFNSFAGDIEEDKLPDLRADFERTVLEYSHENEYEAYSAYYDFLGTLDYPWSPSFTTRSYTYPFLWCLYAIVWGIKKYKEQKAG